MKSHNAGRPLTADTRKLGVRHFSRFSRSAPSHGPQNETLLLRGRRSNFHLEDVPVIHRHRAGFAQKISAEAAPAPLTRPIHQAPLRGIPVHVAEFLRTLASRPHIEVVETFLP